MALPMRVTGALSIVTVLWTTMSVTVNLTTSRLKPGLM
jgi:hypothetical protein